MYCSPAQVGLGRSKSDHHAWCRSLPRLVQKNIVVAGIEDLVFVRLQRKTSIDASHKLIRKTALALLEKRDDNGGGVQDADL